MKKTPTKTPPSRKSQSHHRKSSNSGDFPVRHLTKSEYMKVRNIPLLVPDPTMIRDYASAHITQTINPFSKDNYKKETEKKTAPANKNEIYEFHNDNHLMEELIATKREKEELSNQLENLILNQNRYQEDMQREYQKKINKDKEIRAENEALRKENEILLSELNQVKIMKENVEKRIIELEKHHNNNDHRGLIESLEDRNRNLQNEIENNNQKMKRIIDENNKLKNINEKLLLQMKEYEDHYEKLHDLKNDNEKNEQIVMLSTEIERLKFLLKEKDVKHKKEMESLYDKNDINFQKKLEKELQEIVEKYQEEILKHQKENEHLKMRINELEKQNLDLKTKIEKIQHSVPELMKENEFWRLKALDLEKNNGEILYFRQALVEKDKEIDIWKKKLYNLEQENEANKSQSERIKKAGAHVDSETNLKLMRDIHELIEQNKILNGDYMRKNDEVLNLDRKNKELINQLNELQKNIPVFNEEKKRELFNKIKDLESKIAMLISENERVTNLFKEKANENDNLKNLLNKNNESIDYRYIELENSKKEEIERIIREITNKFINERKDLEIEIINLRNKINELARILSEKDNELNNFRNQRGELVKKSNLNNILTEAEKKEYENKITILSAENELMKKKIEDISRENYNLRESPKKTAIQNGDLENKLNVSERERIKLQTILSEKQLENQILASRVNDLGQHITTTINPNLEEELIKLSAEKTSLETVLYQYEQKLKDYMNQIDMLKSDNNKMMNQLKEKINEAENWKNKFIRIEKTQIQEISDLRQQIDEYKKNNLDVREINLKFSTEKTNYEAIIKTLKQEIQNKKFELDKSYELLNLRKNELDAKSKECMSLKSEVSSNYPKNYLYEIENLSSQIKGLVDENDELRKLANHYKSQSDKKDIEFMKKSQEINNKIQDLDTLKNKFNSPNSSQRYFSPKPNKKQEIVYVDSNRLSGINGLNYNYDTPNTRTF